MDSSSHLFVCLLICVYFSGVLGQVGSLCRPNERLLDCGCPKTCKDPVPDCKGVCRPGCFCEEDEYRNDEGICVKLADCPASSFAKKETSEPRSKHGNCPENEEYQYCEPCNRTCDNPNPVCPAQCARGCFCKDGLVRDKDGKCVKYAKCSKFAYLSERPNLVKPVVYQLSCSEHQVAKYCEYCEWTCNSPRPVCTSTCTAGCFCEPGFFKSPSGKCVTLEQCPQGSYRPGKY